MVGCEPMLINFSWDDLLGDIGLEAFCEVLVVLLLKLKLLNWWLLLLLFSCSLPLAFCWVLVQDLTGSFPFLEFSWSLILIELSSSCILKMWAPRLVCSTGVGRVPLQFNVGTGSRTRYSLDATGQPI